MIEKKEWKEFKDSGLLWWVNMILHTFGWVIVFDKTDDGLIVYPARTQYRGFSEKVNTKGYTKVTKYLEANSETLLKECDE